MEKKSIVLSKSDHHFLLSHLEKSNLSDYNKEQLSNEIKAATLYDDDKLPENVVSLYTKAKIKSTENGKEFNFTIVEPKYADIKTGKVSVFAPISIALFGYQTGDTITWEMPDGLKTFVILEVLKVEKPNA